MAQRAVLLHSSAYGSINRAIVPFQRGRILASVARRPCSCKWMWEIADYMYMIMMSSLEVIQQVLKAKKKQ